MMTLGRKLCIAGRLAALLPSGATTVFCVYVKIHEQSFVNVLNILGGREVRWRGSF